MPYADREKQRDYQRSWMVERKRRALNYLVNQCVYCGTTKNLEIDHVEPTSKTCPIAGLLSHKWETVVAELDKCQVVCHDCHVRKTKTDGSVAIGEKVGTSKLSAEEVRTIRRLAKTELTQREIGAMFNVDYSTVGRIARRVDWSHLE